MLSYAFSALRQNGYEKIAIEKFDNIHNLFAAILAKGTARQVKRGLYREYAEKRDNICSVRGKIEVRGTIANRLARRRVITCEYGELSENNLINQIIKTTAMLLLRCCHVDGKYKDELKKGMFFFSDVDTVDPSTIKWDLIRLNRNNRDYRMLVGICRLVIDGMLLTAEDGEYCLGSFIDEQNICRLYEKFILEYYAQEHTELSVCAAQIPWALDDGDDRMLPVMRSDVTLAKGCDVLIIDAKYYEHATQSQYNTRTIHSHNLYQIFAYVKNKDKIFGESPHKVSGLLLYAATDEDILPNQTYQMSGNSISVKTLDLNCEFSQISAQLDSIADEHFSGIPNIGAR